MKSNHTKKNIFINLFDNFIFVVIFLIIRNFIFVVIFLIIRISGRNIQVRDILLALFFNSCVLIWFVRILF